MLLVSITALKEVVDRDPTTASTVTLITCYEVIIGPYPVVVLQSIIDFSSGTLIYKELCNHRRNTCHFARIDSVLAHVVQKLRVSDYPVPCNISFRHFVWVLSIIKSLILFVFKVEP